MESVKFKIINRDVLKYIAIAAMLLDHIAGGFLVKDSAVWLIFRIIGRTTLPVMAYMTAEGFRHTRDLKKYILRMFLFSVISFFTFTFFETGTFVPVFFADGAYTDYAYNSLYIASMDKTLCITRFSVITGLLCALLTLTVCEKTKWNPFFKTLAALGLFAVSLNSDWCYITIPMVLVFYYFKDNKPVKWGLYGVISLLYIFDFALSSNLFDQYFIGSFRPYRLGMLILPVLIEVFYNGKKGFGGSFSKWFFYAFYPAHQLVLGIISAVTK